MTTKEAPLEGNNLEIHDDEELAEPDEGGHCSTVREAMHKAILDTQ